MTMRSRAASARRRRDTARSRSVIGGPPSAIRAARKSAISAASQPRAARIRATSGAMPAGASIDRMSGSSQRRSGVRVMSRTSFSCHVRTMVDMRAVVLLIAVGMTSACAAFTSSNDHASPLTGRPTTASSAAATPSSTLGAGLDEVPVAQAMGGRRWYTVPDGLIQEKALVAVAMAADALPGQPRARLRETGATVPLSFIVAPRVGNQWSGSLDLAGAAPGEQTVDFLVRIRDGSDESETERLIDHAVRLMTDHGMPKPTSFRAGGLFANAANLRAVAAAGFTADTSATPAGPFGSLTLPWTLPKDAQPYRPSRTDANAAGDLPMLEVPNNAGNTYGLTSFSIQRVINDDLAMLPPVGTPSAVRRALTFVSHPATIDAPERAAIEKLFQALEPYRWDRDKGPLRFVTIAQVAAAYAR